MSKSPQHSGAYARGFKESARFIKLFNSLKITTRHSLQKYQRLTK